MVTRVWERVREKKGNRILKKWNSKRVEKVSEGQMMKWERKTEREWRPETEWVREARYPGIIRYFFFHRSFVLCLSGCLWAQHTSSHIHSVNTWPNINQRAGKFETSEIFVRYSAYSVKQVLLHSKSLGPQKCWKSILISSSSEDMSGCCNGHIHSSSGSNFPWAPLRHIL